MPRKRARDEAELDISAFQEPPRPESSRLWQLRNMWQFSSFMQFIYFFGKAVKIDDSIDIDELEDICMNPERQAQLADIGLALLKYVSSHRGLTSVAPSTTSHANLLTLPSPEIFDEYTRRQYLAKAPERNPYGDEEAPKKFSEFDIFTRIKVLQQLSTWTLGNAERMRSLMEEKESEQTGWRIEPFGWDSEDRSYYVLDDDRLYRQTDAPLPPAPLTTKTKTKAKAKGKPRTKPTRLSKRQRMSNADAASEDEDEDVTMASTNGDEQADQVKQEEHSAIDNDQEGFGGMKWECIAVTMDEYQDFLETIRRSRDPNEKALYKAIIASVIPILEKRAEAQRQKALKKAREWENAQKMMSAKRSSRLAGKVEKQKEAEEAASAEQKRISDLAMAHREQQRQVKMDMERQSRMQTREQRLREREVRRILHEEELSKLEELKAKGEDEESRHSSRNLKNEVERRQKELEVLKEQEEEDKWIFDCSGCGLHGENIDDGTHSIACEKCNIWQHSKCNGIKVADAERDDFHFICSDCKRKEEAASRPRISIKLGKATPSSPATSKTQETAPPKQTNGRSNTNQDRSLAPVPAAAAPQSVSPTPILAPNQRPAGDVGRPAQAWQGGPLQPQQHANAVPSYYPQYHQHHNVHANAVAAAGVHPTQPHFKPSLYSSQNGTVHAAAQSPPMHGQHRPPPPQSTFMNSFSTNRAPSGSPVGGAFGSPIKQKQPNIAPKPPRPAEQGGPLQAKAVSPQPSSPYHNLSPPPSNAAQQRLAGQSPVKQASPSPPPGSRQQYVPVQSSPSMPPPAATPIQQQQQISHVAPSPAPSLLPASPYVGTSPIPPLGAGPVIPQKHDAGRAPSRDHATETAVFPPATNLSPARLEDGKGLGVNSGEGGLGTGQVPVKKLPGELSSPLQPPAAGRLLQQVQLSPTAGLGNGSNGLNGHDRQ